ncbi:MAG: hypothetical protein NVSMB27_27200 [Ktedonobacteraceae bacterium]
MISCCPLFPADNIWNRDISTLAVHPNSAIYIASIGNDTGLHPDFGVSSGIPYKIVQNIQRNVPITFSNPTESDPGPYPIPSDAPIESGEDRHVIVVNTGTCKLYEMYKSSLQNNGSWTADSGAMWDLNSNALRPKDWTSADAAGLPILPGLVRYDEVTAVGAINHALRFTVKHTQNTYIWPARHKASANHNSNLPPMGLRLRLKANVDISSFSCENQIILTALKHYGMFVADNGQNWFITGAQDNRWDDGDLHNLTKIKGSDFEVVDESGLQVSPDSAQSL